MTWLEREVYSMDIFQGFAARLPFKQYLQHNLDTQSLVKLQSGNWDQVFGEDVQMHGFSKCF